jgi:hypothetical protein
MRLHIMQAKFPPQVSEVIHIFLKNDTVSLLHSACEICSVLNAEEWHKYYNKFCVERTKPTFLIHKFLVP